MKYFLENFRKDIKGILWWAIGLFITLSLYSYHPKDPSFSSTGGFDQTIQNYCGYFGSFMADLFFQWMGLLSWMIPIACFHLGLKNFSQKRLYKDSKSFSSFNVLKLILALILIFCLTALLTLYFPNFKFKENQITIGGLLGLFLSQSLTNIFNFIGASIVLWTMTLMAWVLYTERPLVETLSWPFHIIFWIVKKIHSFSQSLSHFIVHTFSQLFSYLKNYSNYLRNKFQMEKIEKENQNKKENYSSSNLKNQILLKGQNQEKLPFFPFLRKKIQLLSESLLKPQTLFKQNEKNKEKREEAFFFPLEELNPKDALSSHLSFKKSQLIEQKLKEQNFEKPILKESEFSSKENLKPDSQTKLPGLEKTKREVNPPQEKEPALNIKEKESLKSSSLKPLWKLPTHALFKIFSSTRKHKMNEKEINQKVFLLKEKLQKFNIGGEVIGYRTGPAVTLFEFKPQANVKISRITDLADDLSLALSSESVRIIAPIPGRNVVGIETSNVKREKVSFIELLLSSNQEKKNMKLPIILGLRADGTQKLIDLRKMPHMMVAGSTGSGKSSFILSAITSLLFSHSPETLRFILIDPKQVDLMSFISLPHLLMPPIRTPQKALEALKWVLTEMEERYQAMSKVGAKTLESFNEIVKSKSFSDSDQNFQKNDSPLFPQPYIVVVIEEFSDLMSVDKAPVEQAIIKLAQMARACGIHLILAMQSPRRDVITGLIKTNIPGRISFKVASKLDSRIILDESGAERLLNCGDMLFLSPGLSQPERCHAPWVEEEDIKKLIDFWKKQAHLLSTSPFPPFESMLSKNQTSNKTSPSPPPLSLL